MNEKASAGDGPVRAGRAFGLVCWLDRRIGWALVLGALSGCALRCEPSGALLFEVGSHVSGGVLGMSCEVLDEYNDKDNSVYAAGSGSG